MSFFFIFSPRLSFNVANGQVNYDFRGSFPKQNGQEGILFLNLKRRVFGEGISALIKRQPLFTSCSRNKGDLRCRMGRKGWLFYPGPYRSTRGRTRCGQIAVTALLLPLLYPRVVFLLSSTRDLPWNNTRSQSMDGKKTVDPESEMNPGLLSVSNQQRLCTWALDWNQHNIPLTNRGDHLKRCLKEKELPPFLNEWLRSDKLNVLNFLLLRIVRTEERNWGIVERKSWI